MVVLPIRSAAPGARLRDDAAPDPVAAAEVARVLAAVMGWASAAGVADVVVAGHHAGALLACEAAAGVSPPAGMRLTVVAFGAGPRRVAPGDVAMLEVVRGMQAPVAAERPDEYLHDIRALYETGDLADMLRENETHTVIRLPAAARQ
jgi:hypothetical protein